MSMHMLDIELKEPVWKSDKRAEMEKYYKLVIKQKGILVQQFDTNDKMTGAFVLGSIEELFNLLNSGDGHEKKIT